MFATNVVQVNMLRASFDATLPTPFAVIRKMIPTLPDLGTHSKWRQEKTFAYHSTISHHIYIYVSLELCYVQATGDITICR